MIGGVSFAFQQQVSATALRRTAEPVDAAGPPDARSDEAKKPVAEAAAPSKGETAAVTELKKRDAEVRRHEQAHRSVGGAFTGAIHYEFQRGPNGQQYAVGGEVSIDVAPVPGDPQATVDKMTIVKRAALAPSEPSGQDRAVAAKAEQIRLAAQAELNQARSGGEAEKPGAAPAEDAGAISDIVGTVVAGAYNAAASLASGRGETRRFELVA
ncbi:MAG: hypothetical protein CMM50_11175 [Rhodospirillaceae bacterium]|nr:hypothetical protein [Rhodospirillaceae bacterium]